MLAFVVEEDKRSGKLLVIGKICQDLMKSQYGESDPSSSCENLHAMESKIVFKDRIYFSLQNAKIVENI